MSHIVVLDGKRVIASGTVIVFPDDEVIEISVEAESVFFDLQIADRKPRPSPIGSRRHVVMPELVTEATINRKGGLSVRFVLEKFAQNSDVYKFNYLVFQR